MKKVVLVPLLVFLIFSQFQLASAENWVEVKRYAGEGMLQGDSEPFTVEHINWRIRWKIEPTNNGSDIQEEKFSFDVNLHFEKRTVASVTPTTQKNGTLNFNWVSGKFYLSFPTRVPKYTIIVEQNIDSIPEFSSWTILAVFLISTSTIAVYTKKVRRQSPKIK